MRTLRQTRCLCPIPFLLLLCAVGLAAQEGSRLPRANEVVEAHPSVLLDPAPRGRAVELDVALKIRPGFHINAHEASEDYLIPTKVEADLPPGFRVLSTEYPHGVLRRFKFSPKKLSVYEGAVAIRMKIEVSPNASLGPSRLPLTLHYQACNEELCLPPVKVRLTAALTVAPADARSSAKRP